MSDNSGSHDDYVCDMANKVMINDLFWSQEDRDLMDGFRKKGWTIGEPTYNKQVDRFEIKFKKGEHDTCSFGYTPKSAAKGLAYAITFIESCEKES